MHLKEEHIGFLMRIKAYEGEHQEQSDKYGWTWRDVQTPPYIISTLLTNGLLTCVFQSNKTKSYKLSDTGKEFEILEEKSEQTEVDFFSLFFDIVGYDNIKEVIRESLQLEKPIHILLHGGPAIAKSMFLYDIERAGAYTTVVLMGSATSHAGMWDLISERKPRYILIDEIDKLGIVDMSGLLSLMEQGRIIRTKVGRTIDVKVDACIIAAANRVSKMPPELLSRFAKFYLGEYNTKDFITVVENVLVRREDMTADDAHNIALGLVGRTHDVREAVRVARLSKRVGVARAVELLSSSVGSYNG